MKKIFQYTLIAAAFSLAIAACSSGAYIANPSSNANGSVNPLNPLKADQFSWAGNGSRLSMNINGNQWSTDSAYFFWIDSIQTNYVYGFGGGHYFVLELKNVWGGNLYNMGFKQYNYLGYLTDSATYSAGWFQSVLGNSGELDMTTNDSLTFSGKFYFQGVDAFGNIKNISNGFFNIPKF